MGRRVEALAESSAAPRLQSVQQELWLIQPDVLVCLGATAARAALGHTVTIAGARGRVLVSSSGNPTVVTVHPSAILRTRDSTDRQAMMRQFVADLRRAARVAGKTVRRG